MTSANDYDLSHEFVMHLHAAMKVLDRENAPDFVKGATTSEGVPYTIEYRHSNELIDGLSHRALHVWYSRVEDKD